MENSKLKSTPNNSVPPGADVEQIDTRDRVGLRTAIWQPTDNLTQSGEPLGTVCLFQGRTEFIEKYYDVITELRARGFVVATLDWRGQGLSQRLLKDRLRGHVRNFKHYQRDLEAFLTLTVTTKCPRPYYALAHSMGGHVLFSEAAGGRATLFDRMVLTAPMLYLAPNMLGGLHMLGRKKKMPVNKIVSQRPTRWFTGFLSMIGLGQLFVPGGSNQAIYGFEGNALTSDEDRFDRFNELLAAHPELGIGSPTNRWTYAACRSMRRILRPGFLKRVNVPMMVIASGSDRVISTPALERIVPRLRVGSHIVIQEAKHEIMFEREELRSQFWAAFDAFIPGSDPAAAVERTRQNGYI